MDIILSCAATVQNIEIDLKKSVLLAYLDDNDCDDDDHHHYLATKVFLSQYLYVKCDIEKPKSSFKDVRSARLPARGICSLGRMYEQKPLNILVGLQRIVMHRFAIY